MDANKIDMFFIANGKKLPAEKALLVREKMVHVDDSRYATITSIELKDPTTMLLISFSWWYWSWSLYDGGDWCGNFETSYWWSLRNPLAYRCNWNFKKGSGIQLQWTYENFVSFELVFIVFAILGKSEMAFFYKIIIGLWLVSLVFFVSSFIFLVQLVEWWGHCAHYAREILKIIAIIILWRFHCALRHSWCWLVRRKK